MPLSSASHASRELAAIERASKALRVRDRSLTILKNGLISRRGLMKTLEELADSVVAHIRDKGARSSSAARLAKIWIIPAAAAIAGVMQFAEFENGRPTAVQLWGIVAAAIAGVLALVMGLAEKDSGAELATAYEALEVARQAQSSFDEYETLDSLYGQALELMQAVSAIRAVVERTLVDPTGSEERLMQNVLRVAGRSLAVAMGFDLGGRWTITIYRAERQSLETKLLRAIATDRAIPSDLSHSRTWVEGTGIAGACYSNRCQVVIPDLSRPGIKELFGTNANASKDEDLFSYRSMAAAPVDLDGQLEPWGVVVATSDDIGHFDAESLEAMRPDIVVKELAGMVALAAAAWARVEAIADHAGDPQAVTDDGTETKPSGLNRSLKQLFKR